jgi:hypothetical protein
MNREAFRWAILLSWGAALYLIGDTGLHLRSLPTFVPFLWVIILVGILLYPGPENPLGEGAVDEGDVKGER